LKRELFFVSSFLELTDLVDYSNLQIVGEGIRLELFMKRPGARCRAKPKESDMFENTAAFCGSRSLCRATVKGLIRTLWRM